MDQLLVEGHLKRAVSAATPYERFDWAWKAFNVLYSVGAERRDGERTLVRAAARQMGSDAEAFFNHISLRPLVSIAPVFEEKAWQRAGVQDSSRHREVQRRLTEIGTRAAIADDVVALVDLLYVIRCNLAHGFKGPERPRDQEVLDAAAPILLSFVQAVFTRHLRAQSRSA